MQLLASAGRFGSGDWTMRGQLEDAAPARCLEHELHSELDQSWRFGRQDLVEGRRTDVAIGQAEIRVVQEVEKLSTELEFFALSHGDIFEQREIPIRVAGTLRDVSACGAELLDRRIRILCDLLEGRSIEP